MFRQSPGRNQRSKGIKLKHVLQVCFLLAICFWLLYQVKHSQDKKKEFDESDTTVSVKTESSSDLLKLGRKDLNPKVEETVTSRKQDEDAEEEETTGEDEEIKHEEEEQEDHKSEEKDDEGRGGGEDEIDEHEREKSDEELDREEVMDEEKEKVEGDEKEEEEEKDSEDNNRQSDKESSSDEQDTEDETAKSTHEAREEHYKADDASSAVTHETQIITDENESQNLENSNKLAGTNTTKNESEIDNTDENGGGENTTGSEMEGREMAENGTPLNVTTANEEIENVAARSEDGSFSSNSTSTEQSSDHPELNNNTAEVSKESIDSSVQNGAKTQTHFSHLENVTVAGTTSGDDSGLQTIALHQGNNSSLDSSNNQADSKPETSFETGNFGSNSMESSKSDNSIVSETRKSGVGEDNSGSSDDTATEAEKSVSDEVTGTSDDASKTENSEEVQHDPIDSSDSLSGLEEKHVRTDLETLPEMKIEGINSEDAAAE